jgi:hypothetical protein
MSLRTRVKRLRDAMKQQPTAQHTTTERPAELEAIYAAQTDVLADVPPMHRAAFEQAAARQKATVTA